MRMSEDEDNDKLKGFIFILFGYESNIARDNFFIALEEPRLNWVFNAAKIRSNFEPFFDEKTIKAWEEEQE